MAASVIVPGAGMVGGPVALPPQRRGREMTPLDRQDPGEGASFRNGGLIRREAVHPHPFPRRIAGNQAMDVHCHPRPTGACRAGGARIAAPGRARAPARRTCCPSSGRCLARRAPGAPSATRIKGLTPGPTTGRLLAETMCGGAPFPDPAPHPAERF